MAQVRKLVPGEALAVHACVHVQGDFQRRGRRGDLTRRLDLDPIGEHGGKVPPAHPGGRAGNQSVEDEDPPGPQVAQAAPQGDPLVHPGDKEGPCAGVPETAGGGGGAKAIAVGRHHRGDLGIPGDPHERRIVPLEGGEVDRQARAVGHLRAIPKAAAAG